MRSLWRQALWPLAGLFALNGVVYAAYTRPRSEAERTVAQRAAALRDEVEQQQRQIREERRKDRILTSNADDVEALYLRAGRKATILRVRDEVEALAREIGFRLGARSYSNEPVPGLPLTRFRFVMPVTGSYAQLVAFLGRLERSGHFVTVDKVVLRSDAEGQAPVLQLTLSSYFVADDEEVTDASAR